MENSAIINKLDSFKRRNKFSVTEWNNRGLNPSSDALCAQLSDLFNNCTDALTAAVNSEYSKRKLKSILAMHLQRFDKSDYDSEERGFIADLFYELSGILDIDFRYKLNSWMYGPLLAGLLLLTARRRSPGAAIATLSQSCSGCGEQLETLILEKSDDIPAHSWDVIQCNSCSEYNILDKGPGAKYYKPGNYTHIEYLSKDEFTEEQALIRLEQIRYFRKK